MPDKALNMPGQQKQTNPIKPTWTRGELYRKRELLVPFVTGDPVSWSSFATMIDYTQRKSKEWKPSEEGLKSERLWEEAMDEFMATDQTAKAN